MIRKTLKKRIGVLMGGPSTERDVSLKSGKAVIEALKQRGIDVVGIDITTGDINENINLLKSYKMNCAFIALHGHFGEDGQVQAILESLNIPYTGSGSLASKLAMDKVISRKILQIYGLHTPRYTVINKTAPALPYSIDGFGFPLVVKPAGHGSSIGLSIIDKREDLGNALGEAFKYDDTVIIEQYIQGRELTVGILDDKALPVIEIVPKKRFFDYEAKYQQGMTDYLVPADLDGITAKKVQELACKVHRALGCFGCSRVDIILSNANVAFVLELNSIPGLTPTSLLPKAAGFAGIDFGSLCLKLIDLAYEKAAYSC